MNYQAVDHKDSSDDANYVGETSDKVALLMGNREPCRNTGACKTIH